MVNRVIIGVILKYVPNPTLGPGPIKWLAWRRSYDSQLPKGSADDSRPILADGCAVLEDCSSSADGHARQAARRRPPGHQRHCPCAQIRRALDRCAAGIRTEKNPLQSLCPVGGRGVWVDLFHRLEDFENGLTPAQALDANDGTPQRFVS